ncbi:MAG: YoaK family protein [Marmoricola sp.]
MSSRTDVASRSQAIRVTSASVHLGAMLILTFSTGVADAVGYLGLDKVFTGNMTGNVVILGMGLTGTADLPVEGPLIALFAFMAGAACGGRVLRRSESGAWTRATTSLLFVVAAAFATSSVVLGGVDVEIGSPTAYVLTALLAAAMGLQASVARHLAVKDVTTVVVTSTITGLAADSRLGAAVGQPWGRRSAAIVLIGTGAGVGALLLTVSLTLSVAVPAALTVLVATAGGLLTSKERRMRSAQKNHNRRI